MTPDQAAWVRVNVWTDAMRRGLTGAPHCDCQRDATGWACNVGVCWKCDFGEMPGYETTIRRHGSLSPASLPKPMRHNPRTAFGSRTMAMVWLADRTCRRVCGCGCHTAPAAPEQLGLFGAVA